MRTIQRDIVGAFIFSADDKLLMGKGGVYDGAWLIPGGGIDEDETKLQAVIREVREETGLDISGESIKEIDIALTGESEKTLRDTGERVLVEMIFFNYLVRLPQPAAEIEAVSGDDLSDIQWFPTVGLNTLQLSPPSIAALKKLGYLSE